MTTNLIIACWSGPRRNERDELLNIVPYPTTRIGHLQKQIATLGHYKHQLTQITLVVPPYVEEPDNFTRYLSRLPERLGGAKLEVYRSPSNLGWSYGSWNSAVQRYQDFDHYLFLEDDYAFVKDDFDKKIIEMWESRTDSDVQFLCNFYQMPHAIVTNGISSGKVLESRYWQLLDTTTDTDGFEDFMSSLNISGFPKPYHCSPYFGMHIHPGVIICGEGEYLIAPTHTIDPHTLAVDIPDSTPRVIYS
jgi:hypothetical protein